MKVTRISLESFRAFNEPFELNLEGGKNLLLHGENGSGKSSIFQALKYFFEERGDQILRHRNHFSQNDRDSHVLIHLRGKDATGIDFDHDVHWDSADGHPLSVPTDRNTVQISPALRSLLVDGARRSGFVDYRSMLRTHLLTKTWPRTNKGPDVHNLIYGAESEGLESQLFDLVSLCVLDGVRITSARGGETTIGSLARQLWRNRPASRHANRMMVANYHATAFNEAFNALLPELESKLAEFLNYFESHRLSVRFQPIALSWDKPTLELRGAELIPELEFRGRHVSDYHLFLNEARLSALATCLFLSGVALSDNDVTSPEYLRLLVLDDALMGLELENRVPILKILKSDAFKRYQVFLLTHDRVWFDLAKTYLTNADDWIHELLTADETTGELIPLCRPSLSSIGLARKHLANGDLRSAAVHARSAFEWKLRTVCENKGIEVKFKKDLKHVSADDLWRAILKRQNDRVTFQGNHPTSPDFLPANIAADVEMVRSTVLNQLSHADAPGLVGADVRNAINIIATFCRHEFPDA